MVLLEQLRANDLEYYCRANLNLYDSPNCESLTTQAATGRHLRVKSVPPVGNALEVRLCEDNYSGWLPVSDLAVLDIAKTPYRPISLSPDQIQARIKAVIGFTKAAMHQNPYYLWGGTVGPNYDCSGLMQAAFAASGIWLPRDSYQQAAFTQTIRMEELQPGDLVFFATAQKVNHVGLYLGNGDYIHSSGKDHGRNGIAIDQLLEQGDEITKYYYRQRYGAGRVVASYQP
ncbi:MAG: C40 family peptidase [Moorea sp. SIO3G5]|nr:C40 family peptidase [Moorena sp. SIO3G5]